MLGDGTHRVIIGHTMYDVACYGERRGVVVIGTTPGLAPGMLGSIPPPPPPRAETIVRALDVVFRDHRLQLRDAGDRKDDIEHPALRIVNRCLGNVDQQALLPVNPLDVVGDCPDHRSARTGPVTEAGRRRAPSRASIATSPAAHGRIVAVRAHGLGSATLVRLMGVESGRSVPRAANPGRPDMEVGRANETTIRAVAMFVGRAM